MSTFDEQTRALVWAGGFLIEIARDESLPLPLRQRAVEIARHFPTQGDLLLDARFRSPATIGAGGATHEEMLSWAKDCKHGPLTEGTKLAWPS